MTAETLHDALTLLPEDLVAETDQARQRPRVIQWKRWAVMAACAALVLCGGRVAWDFFTPKCGTEAAVEAVLQGTDSIRMKDQESAANAAAGTYKTEEAGPESPMAQNRAPDAFAPAEDLPEEEAQLDAAAQETEAEVSTFLGKLWKDEATICFCPEGTGEPLEKYQTALLRTREALDQQLAELEGAYNLSGLNLEVYDESWFEENDLLLVRLPVSGWYPDSIIPSGNGWTLRLNADSSWEAPGEQWIFLDLTPDVIWPEDAIGLELLP